MLDSTSHETYKLRSLHTQNRPPDWLKCQRRDMKCSDKEQLEFQDIDSGDHSGQIPATILAEGMHLLYHSLYS